MVAIWGFINFLRLIAPSSDTSNIFEENVFKSINFGYNITKFFHD